jgi:hypothetical protein
MRQDSFGVQSQAVPGLGGMTFDYRFSHTFVISRVHIGA